VFGPKVPIPVVAGQLIVMRSGSHQIQEMINRVGFAGARKIGRVRRKHYTEKNPELGCELLARELRLQPEFNVAGGLSCEK